MTASCRGCRCGGCRRRAREQRGRPPAASAVRVGRTRRACSRRAPASRPRSRHLRRHAGGDRLHDLLLGRLRALEDADVAAEPQDGDPVATSKMSCRLCEMSTTARPCSARRLTSSSTCSVCATPSAAVGSSRMTSREFHMHRPRDRDRLALPAGERRDGLADRADRRDGERLQRLGVFCSIGGSLSRWNRSCTSRPRYMFWTTSRLSQSARSW